MQGNRKVANVIHPEDFMSSASNTMRPTAPMNEPVARVTLSWTIFPTNLLARREKVVTPPMTVRFPGSSGE